MKKMLFILNPIAGMRKANKVLTDILGVFNRSGWTVETYVTAQQGDGKAQVLARGKDANAVVCCGGDGTFNEVLSGVLEAELDVSIGYIPSGSTNDFATTLGLPTDPMEAAKRVVDGQAQSLDVGEFNGRYFSYVASFGAFTKASYSTPQSIKNALGHTAYLLEGIQELSQIRKVRVKMELDGETVEDDFLFGAVCNSTSVAGILTLSPDRVDLQDGKFEVLLVRAPKDLSEIAECIQAVQKQTYDCRMLTFRSASEIRVFADPDMTWTLDGERQEGAEQIRIRNLHMAAKVIR